MLRNGICPDIYRMHHRTCIAYYIQPDQYLKKKYPILTYILPFQIAASSVKLAPVFAKKRVFMKKKKRINILVLDFKFFVGNILERY